MLSFAYNTTILATAVSLSSASSADGEAAVDYSTMISQGKLKSIVFALGLRQVSQALPNS